MPSSALFLDRDGVINVDRGYVHRPDQFEFFPGIFELARFWTNELQRPIVARGIDRSALAAPQPLQPERFRIGGSAASHPIPRYMQPRDVGVAPGCQRWLGPRLD
jgi:hypothetical protein